MTGWVIARIIPLRFDASRAAGLTAAFELRVRETAARPPVHLGLHVDDGSVRVTRGVCTDAGAVATVGLSDLIRLSLGLVSWPKLMSTGRLVLSGDPFLALRFPSLFRLPAEPRLTRPAAAVRRSTY